MSNAIPTPVSQMTFKEFIESDVLTEVYGARTHKWKKIFSDLVHKAHIERHSIQEEARLSTISKFSIWGFCGSVLWMAYHGVAGWYWFVIGPSVAEVVLSLVTPDELSRLVWFGVGMQVALYGNSRILRTRIQEHLAGKTPVSPSWMRVLGGIGILYFATWIQVYAKELNG